MADRAAERGTCLSTSSAKRAVTGTTDADAWPRHRGSALKASSWRAARTQRTSPRRRSERQAELLHEAETAERARAEEEEARRARAAAEEATRREAEAEAQRRAAEITEDARRRAREQLEQAELEAKRIVADTSQERARVLSELEQERSLLEETRTKLGSLASIEQATRTAEAAARRRRATASRPLERERGRSAAQGRRSHRAAHVGRRSNCSRKQSSRRRESSSDARHERTRLVEELARERSVLEETRTRLSGFLTDALEEVGTATGMSEGSANVQDLDEARAVRTSTGADH